MSASQIIIIICTIYNIFFIFFMISRWKKILKEKDFSILEIRENIANEFLKIVERRKEGNELILEANQEAEEDIRRGWESIVWEDRVIIDILKNNKNLFPEGPYLQQEEENE